MTTEIWIAIIAGISGLVGTGLGSYSGFRLVAYRVEKLEEKVDKHNSFAERIPVLEERVRVANRRIDDLEKAAVT